MSWINKAENCFTCAGSKNENNGIAARARTVRKLAEAPAAAAAERNVIFSETAAAAAV